MKTRSLRYLIAGLALGLVVSVSVRIHREATGAEALVLNEQSNYVTPSIKAPPTGGTGLGLKAPPVT